MSDIQLRQLPDDSRQMTMASEYQSRIHLALSLLHLEFVNFVSLTFKQRGLTYLAAIPWQVVLAIVALMTRRATTGEQQLLEFTANDINAIENESKLSEIYPGPINQGQELTRCFMQYVNHRLSMYTDWREFLQDVDDELGSFAVVTNTMLHTDTLLYKNVWLAISRLTISDFRNLSETLGGIAENLLVNGIVSASNLIANRESYPSEAKLSEAAYEALRQLDFINIEV